MARGDVIFVKRSITIEKVLNINFVNPFKSNTYRHYGIDVGDNSVIHFHSNLSSDFGEARIKHTSLSEFLDGGDLEVDFMVSPAFSPDIIVERAKSKVGNNLGGYDLINNNCEHFANWCANGEKTSRQVWFKEDDNDIYCKISYNCSEFLETQSDNGDKFLGVGKYQGTGLFDKGDKCVEKINDIIAGFKGWFR